MMDGRSGNSDLRRSQVVRSLNFPLLNCLTKQNHSGERKMERAEDGPSGEERARRRGRKRGLREML